jgi:hypothetical protein
MGNACASENSGEEAPALIYLAESEGASGAAFGEEAPALAQLVARLETAHANAKANATQSAKLRRRICALGVAAAATLGLSATPPGGTDAAGSALSAGAEPEPEVRGAEAVVDLDLESWSSSSSWSGTGLCRHKGSTGALAPLAAWHGPIPGPIRARYGPDTGPTRADIQRGIAILYTLCGPPSRSDPADPRSTVSSWTSDETDVTHVSVIAEPAAKGSGVELGPEVGIGLETLVWTRSSGMR